MLRLSDSRDNLRQYSLRRIVIAIMSTLFVIALAGNGLVRDSQGSNFSLFNYFQPSVAEAGCYGSVNVSGYYRSNGTYVKSYQRTCPDSSVYNNYSYPGNYNPNTGRISGTYGSSYSRGYGSTYGSSYGTGYGSGYSSGYGSTYGSSYGTGYGSGYSSGYGSSWW